MPVYEYRCDRCQQPREVRRPMETAHLPAYCPVCDAPLRRVYSSPVLGLVSIGRDQSTLLTPVHRWRPTDDLSERRIRDAAARDIGRVHFGYGHQPETGGGPKRSAEPREGE